MGPRPAQAFLAAALVVALACACGGRGGAQARGAKGLCASPGALPAPPADRPRYRIAVRVSPARRRVTGRLAVAFRPDLATDRLVFRLWPNGPRQRAEGAALSVSGVASRGHPLAVTRPDPTTLVARPAHPLAAGERIEVTLAFALRLPAPVLDRLAAGQSWARMGSFFPILAWQPGVGWATDPPSRVLSETSTSPSADFDVRVAAPAGATVLATGVQTAPGRFRARAVRDFALAVGRFRLAHALAHPGHPVRVTAAVLDGTRADPAAFARRARRALDLLARRYGPYPWPAFSVVVTADVGRAGIEYPNIVFEGPGSLYRATTHETAHQWFYSLVGNDQARDPWLDEGLASWAQARLDGIMRYFQEGTLPPAARGRLGAPMTYWGRHPGAYAAGVYVQGVRALAGLGRPHRVDCALRRYVQREAYRIATQRSLVDALADVAPGARRTLARYGTPPRRGG